ncbi:MAG: alginate export family protein, partial [Myxococcales bacterium]|nr:alginate export family protein [Myxococcales bacterium]
PTATPFRAREALHAPDWLWFGLDLRLRFEHLTHDFRAAAMGDARALSLRTLLALELRFEPLVVGVELQDSRAYATTETLLNTTVVDPLELLRAYAGLRFGDVLADGDRLTITAGRMTLDLGSRRLLARNDFRNTINAFTGVDLQWTRAQRDSARLFAVVPVRRRPSDAASLHANDAAIDHENLNAWLWGAFYATAPLRGQLRVESYALGLFESDSIAAPSSDRRLVTVGVRVLRPPAEGEVDGQLEVMAQLGRSRASAAATDTRDLRHRAGALHATLGYRAARRGSPRVALQYDFASGDRDPLDGRNGRFDPLFGARRFDFGPTGLYGPLARSNVHAPGARLELTAAHVEVMAGYRAFALASARDAWTAAGIRDPSGASGRFVGHLLELRTRVSALPGNLVLELGGACLLRGEFSERAPDAPTRDAAYVYTQVTGTI